MCKCWLSGSKGLCLTTNNFLKKEKNTSKNKQNRSIQKNKGEIAGFRILVLITEIEIKAPIK